MSIKVDVILEIDFTKGKNGALICAGDILGWLPPGGKVNKGHAEEIYKQWCESNFKTLSEYEVDLILDI